MPIYETPSMNAKISSSPVIDSKFPVNPKDTGLKLFQADVPYQTTNQTKSVPETCWGPFKSRDHFVQMHFS